MIEIELNSEGIRELLKSNEMKEICEQYAKKTVNELGDGYEMSVMVGKNRVNASVGAVSEKAIKENLKNNTILKAIGK